MTTTTALASRPVSPTAARAPWRAIGAFVAISFGIAALGSVPVWLGGGLQHPQFQLIVGAIMFAPTIAALLVIAVTRRTRRFSLGLSPRPWGRTLLMSLAAMLVFPLAILAAVALAWVVGGVPLDLENLSGFRALIEPQLAAAGPEALALLATTPIHVIAALQVSNILFNTLFAALFVFGEEFGWRGWLLPALMPIGVWPALIVSGVIWGLWHTPIILMGYNYARPDLVGVLMMVVFCVLSGIVLGWLRLRTGSVWPAVFGHAAINASTAVWLMVLLPAGVTPDPFSSSFVGWPGWVVLGVITLLLVVTGQFRRDRLVDPAR